MEIFVNNNTKCISEHEMHHYCFYNNPHYYYDYDDNEDDHRKGGYFIVMISLYCTQTNAFHHFSIYPTVDAFVCKGKDT